MFNINNLFKPANLIPALLCGVLLAGGMLLLHPKSKTGSRVPLYNKSSKGFQRLTVLPAGTTVKLLRRSGNWLQIRTTEPPVSGWINSSKVNLQGGLLQRLIFLSRSGGYTGKEQPFLQIHIKPDDKTSYTYLSVLAPFAVLIGLLSLLTSKRELLKNTGGALLGGFLLLYLLFSGGLLRQQHTNTPPPYDPELAVYINTKTQPDIFCRSRSAASLTRALLGRQANVYYRSRLSGREHGYAFWHTVPAPGWKKIGGSGKFNLYFRE